MKSKAQVWIESVLYTLIAIALIAVVLGVTTPKLNQYRDRVLVEQSIIAMQQFDQKIQEVSESATGTRLIVPAFSIKRGQLIVNPTALDGKKVSLVIDGLRSPYSEADNPVTIKYGNINIYTHYTTDNRKEYTTEIYSFFPSLSFEGTSIQTYPASAVPYKFSIEKLSVGAGTAIKITRL